MILWLEFFDLPPASCPSVQTNSLQTVVPASMHHGDHASASAPSPVRLSPTQTPMPSYNHLASEYREGARAKITR